MSMLRKDLSRPGYLLALSAVIFSYFVVTLGAYTRLVDAGLGCPDWPFCYGHLWAPLTDEAISLANQAWPEFPVDHSIIWPEMLHRYVAVILGLMVLALWWVTWRHRNVPGQPLKLPIAIGIIICIQAAFGAWTVTLKLWPQVVTAHLLGGFLTATLLWLLTLRLSGWQPGLRWVNTRYMSMTLGLITMAALIIQIALGGWTSATYSALACPDFPTCQGYWFPPFDYARGFDIFKAIGPNYLGGKLDGEARAAVHHVHRVGALVVTLLMLVLAWRVHRAGLQSLAKLLVGTLAVQVALGIINVYFALPLWAATAHNGVALVLLMVMTTILYRMYRELSYDQ
ncbi:heme A synthase [Natronospirillum operosum]|uniref:Heme A synthase n=2 Tax=Natronospirillum operosum TaxID=2759953 RepID=A0A4Z0WAT1_9GAMM|nr:heme A synthase [Natronospirillum operosum]